MARMTITETPVAVELSDMPDTELAELPHIECCRFPRFFCGKEYHPELSASPKDDEDECCKFCVDIRYRAFCPPFQPTHMHCPLSALLVICPGPI